MIKIPGLRIQSRFTKGNSRSATCEWFEDYQIANLFRLYPYEHQEGKASFPYQVIGFDFKYTTHICIRRDIPLWQQWRLFCVYILGVAIGQFKVFKLRSRSAT